MKKASLRLPLLSSAAVALAAFTTLLLAGSDLLSEAKRAFASGKYADAAKLLQNARATSADCTIPFLLGLAHFRLHELEAALIELRSAAECDPRNVDAQSALAEAYAQKGDDNRALAAFEAALKLAPMRKAALRGAAALYLRHDMNSQAIAVLQKLVELEPDDSRIRADLGAAHAGAEDLENARLSFQEALKLDQANVSALVGLGHVELKTGKTGEALSLLDKAIGLDPKSFEPRFLRAAAYNAAGRFADAVQDCREAIRLGGKDPQIYYHLARAYRGLGRKAESEQALAQFSALRSRSTSETQSRREAARLMQQARALVDQGKLAEAIAVLEKARALQGDTPELLFRLGGLYYDTRQYDLARSNTRAALELAPAEWTYHYLLGLIEKDSGAFERARKSLETAVRLNPSAAEAFNQLGDLAMRRGDYAEAVQNFKEAKRINPRESAYELNLRSAQRMRK